MSDRQYEIILYGASGFTGELVAEYLGAEHPDLRWAIAGRNQQKLEALRLKLGVPELPILIADSHNTEQLATLVRQTQTVISTVGRFLEHCRIYYFRNGDIEGVTNEGVFEFVRTRKKS